MENNRNEVFIKNCEEIINSKISITNFNTKIENIKNTTIQLLINNNLVNKDEIFEYTTCRDIKDIMYICPKFNNLKFINNSSINSDFYNKIEFYSYFKSSQKSLNDIKNKKEHYRDNIRRIKQIKHIIKDKVWLDMGCGYGGLLDMAGCIPKKTI